MIELHSGRRVAFDPAGFDNDLTDPGLDFGVRKTGGAGEPAPVPVDLRTDDAIAEPPIAPPPEMPRVDPALLLAMVEEVKYPDSLPEEVFIGMDQGSGKGGVGFGDIDSINDMLGAQAMAAFSAQSNAASALKAAGVPFARSSSGTPIVKGVGYASYAPGGGAVVTTTQNAGGGTGVTVANYSTPTAFAAATQSAGTGQPASAAPSDPNSIVVTAQRTHTPAPTTASLQVNPFSSGIDASTQPVSEPHAAAPTPPPAPDDPQEIVVTAKRVSSQTGSGNYTGLDGVRYSSTGPAPWSAYLLGGVAVPSTQPIRPTGCDCSLRPVINTCRPS